MSNFYKDNKDLQFYVDKWINWTPLIEITEHMYLSPDGFDDETEAKQFYTDILDLVGGFVANEIAPHSDELDREGMLLVDGEGVSPDRLAKIFEAIKELDLHGMCVPRELGGMNCPLIVYMINTEIFSRGDVSVAGHHGFHGGIAMAALLYSIQEGSTEFDLENVRIKSTRFSQMIDEIVRGEAWGCMDITEPSAGSDMGAMRTVGEQDEEGNWFVTGQKIFITSGHGKWHFVIARTEKSTDDDDPFAGLSGLSMFLVPAYHDDADGQRTRVVTIDRLEHKLGLHASATASLSFDRAPAQLVGERGEGFKFMLTLMNNARLAVGYECLGICESALRMAREYAQERFSMGKTIDRHEMIADLLDEMDTDIRGIRALAVQGTFHEEMYQKSKLLEMTGFLLDNERAQTYRDEIQKHRAASRRLTPLLKYLAAEKVVEITRRCVQIHGGVGYTRDFGAEKLLRDAIVMPIYEGTSQIQSLMVMKDTLSGIIKNPQGFIRRVAQANWRSRSARDPLERRLAKLQSLSLRAQQHLMTRTATDKFKALRGKPLADWPREFLKNWNPKRDFSYALLHAERLTRILADEAVAELLYAQAKEHPERVAIYERYLDRAEPRARFLLEEITTRGQRLLDQLADADAEDADERGPRSVEQVA
jgi:alkylation response protein AidB-like acyl-CoA dehydrogenase